MGDRNGGLIRLIESQQQRQKDYFNEYLRVQELEKRDLENENYGDLNLHLDVEQRILTKIVRLSKIIANHIYDLKLREIGTSAAVLKRQEELERMKAAAVKNNLENRKLLEKRKTALKPPLLFPEPALFAPAAFSSPPQMVNFSV